MVQSDSVTEPWVDLQADLHAQPRRQLAEARKVLGCLEYTHYPILKSTDTKDMLVLSDASLKRERRQVGQKDASWPMDSCGIQLQNLMLAQLLGRLGTFLT